MKTLIFGGGDLADEIDRLLPDDVVILGKSACDVRSYVGVIDAFEFYKPDAVICTAGLSDRRIGTNIREVVETNLIGAMNVGTAAMAYGTTCVLVASTAGISPGLHRWYGPAKAGVINFVRAMANGGAQIYAVSPGRMDTKMRQDDFPDEDPATRLKPWVVASVIEEVLSGAFASGANVIVRKVGLERIDVYEEVAPCLPSLL